MSDAARRVEGDPRAEPLARLAPPAGERLQSQAAPLSRQVLAQTGMELRLTARRGENLLVTIVIPAAVLLFFGSVRVLDAGSDLGSLVPGVLALAVIATSLVNLGISTAYERAYGVLKRLGGTPLPRGGLVAAKIASVLVVEAVQVALLVAIGLLMGWRPAGGSPLLAMVALLLGTLAFAGLGLAMAGSLRAEATLGLANGLFLVFLLLGGVVVPVDRLPGPVATIAAALPAAALSDALRAALGTGGSIGGPMLLLAVWGVGATLVAVATFRWE
ncbi:MAG TPA: ABC transporter permease [Candidatus Dormibacteraeota bacterium]|nr:ABC transporter permease [Candidatus Dormibacteraeota bacterium]